MAMLVRKFVKEIPKIGQRCLQTYSGSITRTEYNPALFMFDKKIVARDDKIKTVPSFEYNFAALNITNGNIIPPAIKPPAPLQRIEDPTKDERRNIDTPITIVNEITEKDLENLLSIDLPPLEGQNESIEAAVMMEIRRLKMKKHKLRKLRKKMKFVFEKRKLRRRMRREKEFQASLLAQIREAEKFSAEQYVNDKLARLKEVPQRKPELIRIF